MKPTDTGHPDYYHRVVDCQWACPAHTPVPEYIRLIAAGRYDDAYMVNWESNAFPGILGRVCDRPCEPACRRGRVEEKPVAICRLKRVAADLRGDIAARLPKIPQRKNGKRIACIGAGCASLTVANDLLPLGYEVTVFERYDRPGGLMRSNIPAFRLPAQVLDDLIEKNRSVPIIVEGVYDRRALHELGVRGDIRVLNRGNSVLGLCEAIAREYREAIILTDWDVRGGRIARNLRDALTATGVRDLFLAPARCRYYRTTRLRLRSPRR